MQMAHAATLSTFLVALRALWLDVALLAAAVATDAVSATRCSLVALFTVIVAAIIVASSTATASAAAATSSLTFVALVARFWSPVGFSVLGTVSLTNLGFSSTWRDELQIDIT